MSGPDAPDGSMQYDWKQGLLPPMMSLTWQSSAPDIHARMNAPMLPMYERGSFLLCLLRSDIESPRSSRAWHMRITLTDVVPRRPMSSSSRKYGGRIPSSSMRYSLTAWPMISLRTAIMSVTVRPSCTSLSPLSLASFSARSRARLEYSKVCTSRR